MSERSDPTIRAAVPIVPVRDMRATKAFYEELFGFRAEGITPDGTFAILKHGPAEIHFLQTDDAGALHATATNISIYLWVDGLDALYAALEPKLSGLPEGRVRAPFNQAYGTREFHVKDPDGCLLFFAQG